MEKTNPGKYGKSKKLIDSGFFHINLYSKIIVDKANSAEILLTVQEKICLALKEETKEFLKFKAHWRQNCSPPV